ncbi:MAG: dUTP diphosphatase, partial [Clostridia bacterium]|nr:dUTP diphosphatase [Clostridia bacterium]
MQSIKVKRVRENAVLPKRATEGAAGADLYACIDKPVTRESGDLVMIPTGIAIELPSPAVAGFVFARSGLGIKHG